MHATYFKDGEKKIYNLRATTLIESRSYCVQCHAVSDFFYCLEIQLLYKYILYVAQTNATSLCIVSSESGMNGGRGNGDMFIVLIAIVIVD